MVARWHESQQKAGFKFLVTQIMGYQTGGPQKYATGRPPMLPAPRPPAPAARARAHILRGCAGRAGPLTAPFCSSAKVHGAANGGGARPPGHLARRVAPLHCGRPGDLRSRPRAAARFLETASALLTTPPPRTIGRRRRSDTARSAARAARKLAVASEDRLRPSQGRGCSTSNPPGAGGRAARPARDPERLRAAVRAAARRARAARPGPAQGASLVARHRLPPAGWRLPDRSLRGQPCGEGGSRSRPISPIHLRQPPPRSPHSPPGLVTSRRRWWRPSSCRPRRRTPRTRAATPRASSTC